MNKIDMSHWGEFKISDLFDIHPTKHYNDENGKALSNNKLFNVDGKNPVVVNSAYNNGIGGYSNKECNEKGGIITFSDTTTTDAIFYQENDFIGYSHIQGMYPIKYKDKWSKYSMKFFEVSFHSRANTLGYNYVNKFTRDLANDMTIKLPIDKTGEPDWDYMESYMMHIEKLSQDRLSNLLNILQGGGKTRLEFKNWKEFKIKELFNVELAKGDIQAKKSEDGKIPLVSSGTTNNGICKYIAQTNESNLFQSNSISVDMFGKVFYQNQAFYAVGHGRINILLPQTDSILNENIGTFLSTVIEKTISAKYRFNNMCSSTALTHEIIKLPADINGKPDWTYINNYMEEINCKVKNIFNLLNNLLLKAI